MYPLSMHTSIDAQTIAEALGGKRHGKGWRACCPAHGSSNPTSLSISDGENGKILVHCFGGCTQTEVIAELASRELWPKPTPEQRQHTVNRQHREKVEHAETILFLAEENDENTFSYKDKADIDAARKRLGRTDAETAISQPDPHLVEDLWLFDYHCTHLKGVALNFKAIQGDATAVKFFNSDIQSPRGKHYPTGSGGQFIPPKRGDFRKFWMDTVGEEPYRWCLVHRYMKKVFAGLVFSGMAVSAVDRKGNPYTKLTNIRAK